jgi:regulation of enolase protein 1 (concanavalin A-like superfamily)
MSGGAVDLNAGRVFWLPLDEGTDVPADRSGNNLTVTLPYGATWTSPGASGTGYCLSLNGTSQFIRVEDNAVLGLTNKLTIALWLYNGSGTTGNPAKGVLIKGVAGDGNAWKNLGFRTDDDLIPVYRRINWRCRQGDTHPNGLDSLTALRVGGWTHVAVTFDANAPGNNNKIYIDGVISNQNRVTTPLTTNTGPLFIGADTYTQPAGRWFWYGMVDDVSIYNRALSAAEIKVLAGILNTATNPTPADTSTVNTKNVLLEWFQGSNAAYVNGHHVYFGDNYDNVDNGAGGTDKGLCTDPNFLVSGLVPGTTYYWKVIEVNGVNQWPGPIWSFTVSTGKAFNPDPPDGRIYVGTRNRILTWAGGTGTTAHHIYFGTNQTDVTNGTGGTDRGIRTEPNYTPGTLMYDTTYYWRIAEVNGLNGDVWRFVTTQSADPNLVGWWKLDGDYLDASGYENHVRPINDANLSTATDRPYAVGGSTGVVNLNGTDEALITAYTTTGSTLDLVTTGTLTAWVYGGANTEMILAHGGTTSSNSVFASYTFRINAGATPARRVEFRGSAAGPPGLQSTVGIPSAEWTHVAITFDYRDLTGTVNNQKMYINGSLNAQNAATSAIGRTWYYVAIGGRMQAAWLWGGRIDDVRMYNRALTASEILVVYTGDPNLATNPLPADRSRPEREDATILSWKPGINAAEPPLKGHDVYFGTDAGAVQNATTASYPGVQYFSRDVNNVSIGILNPGKTYYWRVDEVNDSYPNPGESPWKGVVWSFTVADYLIVEDFESYTNSDPNIIFKTWKDGLGYTGYPGNGTGSQAGYRDPNYAERNTLFIHGGIQAMPVDYNNTKSPYYSEVDRTFAATQNWAAYGVNLLSLWLRGHPASVGSFVESPASVYTMTASGADIWNVPDMRRPSKFHDELHYAYMQVSGDYAIAVKVESVSNTNAYAKAGVMIRDSIDANSVNVMTCITPSSAGGIRFQHRDTTGGTSFTDANIANINAPYWISLTRQGNYFAAGYSPDGSNWAQLGSTTLTMADPVCIGLALTSHNTAATCTAVFSNVTLYTVPDYTPVPLSLTSKDMGIKSNVAAPVYVTLQDSGARTATITHDDPNIALATTYQEWLIPLARFTSLNPNLDLTKVQKVTVGVGNRGTGTLYFDDIMLYIPRCLSGRPGPAADLTGSDCAVDYRDIQLLTNNWLASSYQVTPVTPSDANLVGWWKFDDGSGHSATDSSGNNLNGTLRPNDVNGPTWVAGKINGGLQFDGTNDYVDVNYTTNLPRWTVCVWVTSPAAPSAAANSASGPVHRESNFQFNWNHQNNYGGDVGVQVGGTWYHAPFRTLLANTWYHLAGTYDGETLKAYKDGVLIIVDTTPSGNPNNETDHLTFGKHSGLAQYFNGTIDDVRIYSRVLSHDEIASLAGRTTFTQPLYPLLTPQNPAINMYEDGAIDLRDYSVLADMWLEDLLWPPPVTVAWGYEFKNDANCYDPGPPKEARDLHLEFNGAVYLIDTGPFTSFAGNGTGKITLSAGIVPANDRTIIRVGSTGGEKTLTKWYWTDAAGQRIGKEMAGVGPSCKKIN